MKNFSFTPFLFFALLSASTLFGQAQEPGSSRPVEAHFEKTIQESSNYKNFEVIRKDKMLELRDSTLKRIGDLKNEIEKGQQNIDSLNRQLSEVKTSLSSAEAGLNAANKEKASISFFGAPTEKSTYKVIMWGIIVILGLLLAVFIYKFKNSNVLTKEAQKNLAEIEGEFEEFRQKALEKQQELGRKLQNERNKRNKID